jgi:hypothetical protein
MFTERENGETNYYNPLLSRRNALKLIAALSAVGLSYLFFPEYLEDENLIKDIESKYGIIIGKDNNLWDLNRLKLLSRCLDLLPDSFHLPIYQD